MQGDVVTGEDIDTQDTSEDEVTVWAPEPTGNDEILDKALRNGLIQLNLSQQKMSLYQKLSSTK